MLPRPIKGYVDPCSACLSQQILRSVTLAVVVVLGAIWLDLFAVLLGGATALLPMFGKDSASSEPLNQAYAALKAAKFNVERVQEQGNEVYAKSGPDVLEVKVKDRAELERLVTTLRTMPGISGAIGDVQYSSVPLSDGTFYAGFFEKKDYNMALFQWTEYTKRETKKENIVMAKFWIANVFEMTENLKDAYDLYYSIINDYPNPDVIQDRLNSVYERRVARKR